MSVYLDSNQRSIADVFAGHIGRTAAEIEDGYYRTFDRGTSVVPPDVPDDYILTEVVDYGETFRQVWTPPEFPEAVQARAALFAPPPTPAPPHPPRPNTSAL